MEFVSSPLLPSMQDLVSTCDGDFFQYFGYRPLRVIGQGMSSCVILCKPRDGSDFQAVKIMSKLQLFGGDSNRELFQNEVSILHRVNHKNIMTMVLACDTPDMYVISMPFHPRGTLEEHIPSMTLTQTDKYFLQLTSALCYLQRNRLAHRDIKPANILISNEGEAILSDFGLSCVVTSERSLLIARCGTVAYMAPEVMNGELGDCINYYKCDTFSLGLVLWAMVVHEEPVAYQNDHFDRLPAQKVTMPGSYRSILKKPSKPKPTDEMGFGPTGADFEGYVDTDGA